MNYLTQLDGNPKMYFRVLACLTSFVIARALLLNSLAAGLLSVLIFIYSFYHHFLLIELTTFINVEVKPRIDNMSFRDIFLVIYCTFKGIFLSALHFCTKNVLKFLIHPAGLTMFFMISIYVSLYYSFFLSICFLVSLCIIIYYKKQLQIIKEVANSLTRHQFIEVAGLPQPFVKLILNIYFFYSNVRNSKDSNAWLRNSAQFLMSYYDVIQLNTVLNTIFQLDMVAQSAEDFLDRAEGMRDNWKGLRDSELAKKTSRVFKGIILSGLIGASGLTFTEQKLKEVMKGSSKEYEFRSTEDLAFAVFDLTVMFCRVGYECCVDQSVKPLLVRNRSVLSLLNQHDKLLIEYASIPVNEKDKCHKLMEDSREFLARANALSKMEPILIAGWKRNIMDRYLKLLKEFNVCSVRKPPFSVLLFGRPGIGKSFITLQIAKFYQNIVTKYGYHDIDFDARKNVYTYNPSDEYFSGYKGAQQWCMVLDDLARESSFLIKNGKTEYLKDIFTIINVVGVTTNQAAVEDKGVIPLIPKLVIATTNVKDLHAGLGVSEPTAVLRRLPYIIEPILKPEYVDEKTGIMKRVDETVHDAWNYKVETYKIVPLPSGGTRGEYVLHNPAGRVDGLCSSEEMYAFLSERIQEHEGSSNRLMESIDDQANIRVCDHDVPTSLHCAKCTSMVAQGISDYIPSWNSPETKLTLIQWYWYRMMEYAFRHHPDRYPQVVAYFTQWEDGRVAARALGLDLIEEGMPGICGVMRKMSIIFGSVISAAMIYKSISFVSNMISKSGDVFEMEGQGNYWAKDEKETFRPPPMHKPGNKNEVVRSVQKSMFRLRVKNKEGNYESMNAFALSEGKYVTSAHVFNKGEKWECIADYCSTQYNVTSQQTFVLLRDECEFLPNDIMVFKACLLPRKHLLKFLPDRVDNVARDCIVVGIGLGGKLQIDEFKGIQAAPINYKYKDDYIQSVGVIGYRVTKPSQRGDCGSLYLANICGGYCIVGMHIAGNPDSRECGFAQISKDVFSCTTENLMAMSEEGDSLTFTKGNKSSGRLGAASHKGVHHWSNSNGVLKGSFAHGVTPKSRVVKTKICDELCELTNYKLPFGAPIMVPFQRDGIWYNPYTLACDVQGQVSPFFNRGEILYIADSFIRETTIDPSWLHEVSNSPYSVAINGLVGNSYINSLPMNTSGGFLYSGTKRQYFDGEPGSYSLKPDVYKDYVTMRSTFASNKTAGVLFNGTLKDEPRKLKKIQSGETRVFTASDVVFSIIVREQYLDIAARIQQHNMISECAVSMDHGTQWEQLYEYICKFGKDRIIAGDYKNYDKRMPAVFIRAAFYVLDSWRAVTSPLNEESENISRAIATELSFPNTSLNRDVIQFFGGNSSGHPLTAILNSIANSLFMRFAYWKLGFDPITFKRHVALMTLGDDNIMGSSLDGFNHVAISKVLGQHSVVYTMAQKEAKSVPFIHISEADFLKRRFKMVEGKIMGPIEHDSIMKSLCLWTDNGNISEDERIAQCYLSARREWALHGEECFNRYTDIMEELFMTGEFVHVKRFFIKRHFYSWSKTVDWVKRVLVDDQGDDQFC